MCVPYERLIYVLLLGVLSLTFFKIKTVTILLQSMLWTLPQYFTHYREMIERQPVQPLRQQLKA